MVKHIGIVLALCASLGIAAKPYFPQNHGNNEDWKTHSVGKPNYGYSYYNKLPQHNTGYWPGYNFHNIHSPQNQGNLPGHGFQNQVSSHNPQGWLSQHLGFHNGGKLPNHAFHNQPSPYGSAEWPSHDSFKPQPNGLHYELHNQGQFNSEKRPSGSSNSRSLSSSEEMEHREFPHPQFQNNFNDLKNYGFPKPFSPHNLGGLEHHDLSKPQSSPEWNNLPLYPMPMYGDQNKVNRPDWYNPHFPQRPQQVKEMTDLSRRRPLFYPIYPYHFYPYSHPSNNIEEFQTAEARRQNTPAIDEDSNEDLDQQKSGHSQHHEKYHPHLPINFDNSAFNHGPHYPLFYPFHKDPVQHEDDDLTSGDAQPYEVQSVQNDQFPFIIIGNHDHFHIPDLLQIIEQWLHGLKPHLPQEDKPEENSSDDIEGSGEEEIIPLSTGADVPFI